MPTTAVVRQEPGRSASPWSEGRPCGKPVTTGLNDGTHVEILSGLEGDETIVKAAAASLIDGQAVTRSSRRRPRAKP